MSGGQLDCDDREENEYEDISSRALLKRPSVDNN
jgi:hypothetical protein